MFILRNPVLNYNKRFYSTLSKEFLNDEKFIRKFININKDIILKEDIPRNILLSSSGIANRSIPEPQLKCIGGTAINDKELHPKNISIKIMFVNFIGGPMWKYEIFPPLDKKVKIESVLLSFEDVPEFDYKYIYRDSAVITYKLYKDE